MTFAFVSLVSVSMFNECVTGSLPDWLTAGIAGYALFYAIKEWQSKHRPYISTRIAGHISHNGFLFTLKLKNSGNQPAKVALSVLRTEYGQERFEALPKDPFYIPASEEIEISVRDCSRAWVEDYKKDRNTANSSSQPLCRVEGTAHSTYEESVGCRFQALYVLAFDHDSASSMLQAYAITKL